MHTDDADERARDVERQMTDAERFAMVYSLLPIGYPTFTRDPRVPDDVPHGAAYVPGVPRLGVPHMTMTDGTMGVTSSNKPGDVATTLPASVALGATFNVALARGHGVIVAREARARGFNVLLGGGINLIREPRNGRNFEYVSEDPLVSGLIGGERVAGTQSQGVIGVLKHVSLNASESNKFWLDARIDPVAHRESDLLAFQIAIERGQPGTLMGAYNKVNGAYCCGNGPILNGVIKDAWGYKGWIHSDWKAVHAWEDALNGLDQQSGAQLDEREWFNGPLQEAVAEGKVSRERISDMVRRMLRSYFAVGIDRWNELPSIDLEAHGAVALETARQGIVLLKNDEGALPLSPGAGRVAVIGGHADRGVLSGAGSSQGTPAVGRAMTIPFGGEGLLGGARNAVYFKSSPLQELKKRLPDSAFSYDPGLYPAAAAMLARRSDIAIVFVTRHESEGFDAPDLSFPFGQDALVDAVSAANPNTVVVMQTGSPVATPWRSRVKAIVQAWFPGQAGGQAIAEVLTGHVNPSGRLPMTFPADLAQTPHPILPGLDAPDGTPTVIEYTEGAEVGYRWFAKTGATPAYAFGHGLSYTTFAYSDIEVTGGEAVSAAITITNSGEREGADVPQLYLIAAPGENRMRLLAFDRVTLKPGASARVSLAAEPRLLGRFDQRTGRWVIASGRYTVAVGRSAQDLVQSTEVSLVGCEFGR